MCSVPSPGSPSVDVLLAQLHSLPVESLMALVEGVAEEVEMRALRIRLPPYSWVEELGAPTRALAEHARQCLFPAALALRVLHASGLAAWAPRT